MFTMAKIRDGSTYLGNHLVANDYYSEGESVDGEWVGSLATKWGLSDPIKAGDEGFENMRKGATPDGENKLTQRRKEGGVKFFDFQVSAQKSVSMMAVMMDDERLREAHEKAASTAFAELEGFAARRVRAGGSAWSENRETTGNLVAAKFTHDSSRALDPQLHSHYVVANVTEGTDGKRYALETAEMVKAVRYAGKVYQNELARGVKEAGYDIETVRDPKGQVTGFEIAGVSKEMRARFSKRRDQIEGEIEKFRKEKGRDPSAGERHVMAKETRATKDLESISTSEVRGRQLDQLGKGERRDLQRLASKASDRGRAPKPNADVEGLLASAVEHKFERASVQRGHEVLAEALNNDLGNVDLDDLKKAAARSSELVALGDGDELAGRFATRGGIEMEKAAVEYVNGTKGKRAAIGRHGEIGAFTREKNDFTLDDEQRKGVEFVLDSRDKVMAIRGVAGAGKTTLLQELDDQVVKGGKESVYLAPTASAVGVLKKEGFENADTVSGYLAKMSDGGSDKAGALVVVDEAGLQSNRQGSEILQHAERLGQRVLFVGDSRQHSSVEAGDFFRLLEDHSDMESHEIGNIRRQNRSDYRDAVKAMASGHAGEGLDRLDKMGWVKEGGSEYLSAAASEFLEKTGNGENLGSTLAVTPTWAENFAMTAEIRDGLKKNGHLEEKGVQVEVFHSSKLTASQLKKAGSYEEATVCFNKKLGDGMQAGGVEKVASVEGGRVQLENGASFDPKKLGRFVDVGESRDIEIGKGDRLLLRKNDKEKGIVNGDLVTVESINRKGALETSDGRTIDTGSYKSLAHGYVVTSHASQGKTFENVIVAGQRFDAKTAYVSTSRGKEECAVHVADKEDAFASIPKGDREAALDIIKGSRKATIERPSELVASGVARDEAATQD